MLWLVLLSCVVKGVFVTYLLGRYTAVSGEYIGNRLAKLPGPRGWLLIAIVIFEMVGATPLAWVPIAKPCGALLHFLFRDTLSSDIAQPVWENLITSCFITLALLFGLRISFERLEKQQLIICLILVVGTIIGTLIVRPDFGKALVGSLRFGYLPEFPEWAPKDAVENPLLTMATAFGYVGGSVMGYIVYANWVSMHRWGMTSHQNIGAIRQRAATRDKIDYLPEQPERVSQLRQILATAAMGCRNGCNRALHRDRRVHDFGGLLFYMGCKALLKDGALLTDQASVWKNIHASLVWVYYICIIVALWGTLQALPRDLRTGDTRVLSSDLAPNANGATIHFADGSVSIFSLRRWCSSG